MYVCGDWKLLSLIFVAKATHVANHLQCVGVNRVDVKEVKLHLADDALKFRQVGAKNAKAVHSP